MPPYEQAWNESDPTGLEPLSSAPAIIRALEIALRERLAEISNFPADGDEPLRLLEGTARIWVGNEADRPNPSGKGEVFYAVDTNKLFVVNDNEDGDPEWVTEPVVEERFKYARYDAAFAPGSRAAFQTNVTRKLALRVVAPIEHTQIDGVTEAVVYVDLSELEDSYDATQTLSLAATSVGTTRNRMVTGWTAVDENRLRFTFMDVYGAGAGTIPDDDEIVEFTFVAVFGKNSEPEA